jgi:hypothetical protein
MLTTIHSINPKTLKLEIREVEIENPTYSVTRKRKQRVFNKNLGKLVTINHFYHEEIPVKSKK